MTEPLYDSGRSSARSALRAAAADNRSGRDAAAALPTEGETERRKKWGAKWGPLLRQAAKAIREETD